MKSMLSIAYVFNKGRLARLDAVKRRESPREFFLGALELRERGHMVDMIEVDLGKAPGFAGGLVNRLAMWGVMPEKMDGAAVEGVWRLLPELAKYDVLVGTTSGIGFSLALFRRLGRIRPPVVVIHCGLLNNPYGFLRRLLTRSLLGNVHTVLYGEGEFAPLHRLCPGIEMRMTVNPFGIDTEFWTPDSAVAREGSVLSVGNDGRRDFETLVSAVRNIRCPVRIVTSRPLPEGMPANVTVIRGNWHEQALSDAELRDLYRRASCVVVPLTESYQPSGQSVTLQAMACGCPVVLTRTRGLWAERMLRDGGVVRLVSAGDVVALAGEIGRLLGDPEEAARMGRLAREAVCRDASCTQFAGRMEQVLTGLAIGRG